MSVSSGSFGQAQQLFGQVEPGTGVTGSELKVGDRADSPAAMSHLAAA
jgi:hypothetical protein